MKPLSLTPSARINPLDFYPVCVHRLPLLRAHGGVQSFSLKLEFCNNVCHFNDGVGEAAAAAAAFFHHFVTVC